MFVVEKIPIDDVAAKGKDRYNSNNHWKNNNRPGDYVEKLAQSDTRHWVNAFHPFYMVLNLDNSDIVWMRAAHRMARYTGRFPLCFADELDETVNKYEKFSEALTSNGGWFCRSERFSLKYGQHGAGPYARVRNIIESLVSSIHGHTPIDDDTMELKLYFFPWVKIDLEFRVFVYKNRITCISQQDLYSSCIATEEKLRACYVKIVNYFNDKVKPNITHIDSYTIDIAILNDGSPYFIEINSFGEEYAAGSALFHWIHDSELLAPAEQGEIVHCRYAA